MSLTKRELEPREIRLTLAGKPRVVTLQDLRNNYFLRGETIQDDPEQYTASLETINALLALVTDDSGRIMIGGELSPVICPADTLIDYGVVPVPAVRRIETARQLRESGPPDTVSVRWQTVDPDNKVHQMDTSYVTQFTSSEEMRAHFWSRIAPQDRNLAEGLLGPPPEFEPERRFTASHLRGIAERVANRLSVIPPEDRHDATVFETYQISPNGIQETANYLAGYHTKLEQSRFPRPVPLIIPEQPSPRAVNRILLLTAGGLTVFR